MISPYVRWHRLPARASLRPAAEKLLLELLVARLSLAEDTDAVDAPRTARFLFLRTSVSQARRRRTNLEIAKTLASYGDIFVLDAFGTAHRAQGLQQLPSCLCLRKRLDILLYLLTRAPTCSYRWRLQGFF